MGTSVTNGVESLVLRVPDGDEQRAALFRAPRRAHDRPGRADPQLRLALQALRVLVARGPERHVRRVHAQHAQRSEHKARGRALGQDRAPRVRHTGLLARGPRVPQHRVDQDLAAHVRLHVEVQVRVGDAREGARRPRSVHRVPRECAAALGHQRADARAAQRRSPLARDALGHGEQDRQHLLADRDDLCRLASLRAHLDARGDRAGRELARELVASDEQRLRRAPEPHPAQAQHTRARARQTSQDVRGRSDPLPQLVRRDRSVGGRHRSVRGHPSPRRLQEELREL